MASVDQLVPLLYGRKPLPPLFPKALWKLELRGAIEALKTTDLVKAGMHLFNDDIPLCHELAQAHETADGNYWHAILHRREGDLGNALYWYRRIEEHPVVKTMQEQYPDWAPKRFIDDIENLTATSDMAKYEELQLAEMQLLLQHCLSK